MSVKEKQAARQKIAALSYQELLEREQEIQSRLGQIGIGNDKLQHLVVGTGGAGGGRASPMNSDAAASGGNTTASGKRGKRRKRTSASSPSPQRHEQQPPPSQQQQHNQQDQSDSQQQQQQEEQPSSKTPTQPQQYTKIPFNIKTDVQWDYLLAEMKWLSTDFQSERKRHKSLAKKQSTSIKQFVKTKEKRKVQKMIQMELKKRKLSNKMARDVMKGWWDNKINRIIAYKQRVDSELVKKRSMDRHLIQLVKQTEKYSGGLLLSNNGYNGVNANESGDGNDISIEEALAQAQCKTNTNGNKKNDSSSSSSNSTNSNNRNSTADDSTDDSTNSYNDTKSSSYSMKRRRRKRKINSQEYILNNNNGHNIPVKNQEEEEEYQPSTLNEIDDETTIEVEEKLGRDMSYEEEINLLNKENEMSVDELRALYFGSASNNHDIGDANGVHDDNGNEVTECDHCDELDQQEQQQNHHQHYQQQQPDNNNNDDEKLSDEKSNIHSQQPFLNGLHKEPSKITDDTTEKIIDTTETTSTTITTNTITTTTTSSSAINLNKTTTIENQKLNDSNINTGDGMKSSLYDGNKLNDNKEEEEEDFKPSSLQLDDMDDETTIEAEEKLGRDMSYEDEIKLLKEENEMSLDELRALYFGTTSTHDVDDGNDNERNGEHDSQNDNDDHRSNGKHEKESETKMLEDTTKSDVINISAGMNGTSGSNKSTEHSKDCRNSDSSTSNSIPTTNIEDPFSVNDDSLEDEFKPNFESNDHLDDETTIAAEERLGRDMSYEDEIALLKQENEMSLEDLKNMYLGSSLASTSLQNDVDDDSDDNMSDATSIISNRGEKEDDEYVPIHGNDVDDETTIEIEEKLGRDISYEEEIKLMNQENEMTVEELTSKYLNTNSGYVVDDKNRKRRKLSSSNDGNDLSKMNGIEGSLNEEDNADEYDEAATAMRSLEIADAKARNTAVSRPFLLASWVKLRKYQQIGLNWLVSTQTRRLNAILADEMGLGKTLQTISLLSYLACYKGIWGPHLIIVPTSCIVNWEMELKRFAPGLKVLCYYGSAKRRRELRQGWTKVSSIFCVILP